MFITYNFAIIIELDKFVLLYCFTYFALYSNMLFLSKHNLLVPKELLNFKVHLRCIFGFQFRLVIIQFYWQLLGQFITKNKKFKQKLILP